MKKATALYRVSTDKQDLAMQKRVIKDYCKEQNIELIDEYYEEDVSGYKTQLKDRKELLKILARAEKENDFDYLIVYIFDRIIRREDEAPFVLSILNKCNVECIQATTGEHIKNADMQDKLMNYLRFWMAEYESVKTSMRVTDSLRTKNMDNKYAGGTPAFGYKLYETNETNKKGKKLKDLCINEDEAWIVRDIFDMYVNKNMGTLSIAEELNTNLKYKGKNRPKKVRDKENKSIVHEVPVRFRQSSLPRMLKNPIYIGKKRYNTIETYRDGTKTLPQDEWELQDYREDLRLIDDDVFFKAQELLKKNKIKPKKLIEGTTKSSVLCSGLAYCECGAKLYSSYSNYRYKRKDGTENDCLIYRYVCREGREINQLHKQKYGKTYYAAKKYDKLVEKAIIDYLEKIDINKLKNSIAKNKDKSIVFIEQNILKLEKDKKQCLKNIDNFEYRIDEDVENLDIYIKGIRRNKEKIKTIEEEIKTEHEKLNNNKQDMNNYNDLYQNLKDYYKTFIGNNLDKKKIVLDKLVEKIIFKNNSVEIILKQYLGNIQ